MRARTVAPRFFLGFALASLFVVPTLQTGCATTQAMRSGAGVPAAEGTVRASEGDNGNTDVSVWVKHLADPAKVHSDATVYVVWIQPRNAAMQNAGGLEIDKNLEGRLDTTTPHRTFTVTVTPEPNGQVAYPSHEPVFTSDVDRGE